MLEMSKESHVSPADRLPPPQGYASWLDFAVETFDTRGPWLDQMFSEIGRPDRAAMREAAREELRRLRAAPCWRPDQAIASSQNTRRRYR
jgi:hypothetical protein